MTNTAATSTAPVFNAFRLIDDGQRLAIHRVAIDDSGAVVAWDPEPARLEVPSGANANDAMGARWRITGQAFGAANCTYGAMPMMLLRDGKLIEIAESGGDNAEPARVPQALIAA
jgi:hypothetical protein